MIKILTTIIMKQLTDINYLKVIAHPYVRHSQVGPRVGEEC